MTDFFRTHMGQTFYESTTPRIARALESIAESLEKIANPLETVESPPTQSISEMLDRQAEVPVHAPTPAEQAKADPLEFKYNDLPMCPYCRHEQDNSDGVFYEQDAQVIDCEACGRDFESFGTPNWTWNTYPIDNEENP